jgi:ribosomal protein S18 acetylase RimI-like enzyme
MCRREHDAATIMVTLDDIRVRRATADDAPAVAYLHADSWQRHYRGAYSDLYLDEVVHPERLSLWTARLAPADPAVVTLVAEDGSDSLVGFAHTFLDDDSDWGAYLDNLHVRTADKRHGVGTLLLDLTAQAVLHERPGSGLYLWVLEQNTAAQGFYLARGGSLEDRAPAPSPLDNPAYLAGQPYGIRVSWPDPSVLLIGREGGSASSPK